MNSIRSIIEGLFNLLQDARLRSWILRNAVPIIFSIIVYSLIIAVVNFSFGTHLLCYPNYPKDGEFTYLKKITKQEMEEACRKQYPKPKYEFQKLTTDNESKNIPAYRLQCALEEINNTIEGTTRDPKTKGINFNKYCKSRETTKENQKYERALFLNYRDENSWFCTTNKD